MEWGSLAIQALGKLPISSVAQVIREMRSRGNLRQDLDAIRGLLDMGLMPTEYRGNALDAKFADDIDSATVSETVRLSTNLFNILHKAKSVQTASELTSPSDEFMYRWVNDACNESNETLQEMWARVLVGEMGRPGAVSKHTHSVIRELTPEIAKKFQILASLAMCSMDGKRPIMIASLTPTTVMTDSKDLLKNYGLNYAEFLDLAEFRLLSLPLENSYAIPLRESKPSGYQFLLGDEVWVLEIPPVSGMEYVSLPGILLSSAGREVFSVVERFVPSEYMDSLDDYFKTKWQFRLHRAKWPLYSPDKFVPKPSVVSE